MNNNAQGAIEKPFRKAFTEKAIAQGAIEYLLIIGAAILVVAVVVISLSGVTGAGTGQIDEQDVQATTNPLEDLLAEKKGELF
jgi:hypothetical protein